MKRTNTLDEKIKQYAAVAVGVVGVTGASAQVVYTDVNPDAVLTAAGTAQFVVDFNGDVVADIAFLAFAGGYTTSDFGGYQATVNYVGAAAAFPPSAAATNAWIGAAANTPDNLTNGSAVGAGGAFLTGQGNLRLAFDVVYPASTSYNFTDTVGNFAGAEGYVGVRFDIAGAAHYGWVRVEVSSDATTMTIKDYAYNATAGTAINAGDMGSSVGINDITNQVIIRNQYNKLNIELVNINNAEISVVNLAGQVVINDQMNSNVKEINMDNLTTGIYMVNVISEVGSTTKKIYVK